MKIAFQQSAFSIQPKQDQKAVKKGLRQPYDCLVELGFGVCFQQEFVPPGGWIRYFFQISIEKSENERVDDGYSLGMDCVSHLFSESKHGVGYPVIAVIMRHRKIKNLGADEQWINADREDLRLIELSTCVMLCLLPKVGIFRLTSN